MSQIYCTSFCNQGHYLKTGRPAGHECYVLSPASLRAEQAGDAELAQKLFRKGPIVRGRAKKS